jgi:hypothetical protein
MKFWEAMKAYDEGQKVRCKTWPKGHFMYRKQDNTSIMDRQEFWFFVYEEWEIISEKCPTCGKD